MVTAIHASNVTEMAPPVPDEATGAMPQIDPNEAAKYDQIVRSYAEKDRFAWHGLGTAAQFIREHELWKIFSPDFGEEPFHGFDDYLERRGQKAKSKIWLAVKLVTALETVDVEDCKRISQQNAIWLMRYVTRIKKDPSKEMLDKAKSMKEKLFADYVNAKMPGAAKEEIKQSIIFSSCDKSLAKVVDQALEVAMWESDVNDRREALERLCTYFLEGPCEHEGFTKLSNRQAFQKSKEKPKAKGKKTVH